MKCPKCHYERNPQDKECPSCGVIYEKWQNHSEKKQVKDKDDSSRRKKWYEISSRFRIVIIFLCIWAVVGNIIFLYNHIRLDEGKHRSRNSAAQSDLRNAATAQEAYWVDHDTYTDSIEDLVGNMYGLFISEGVTVEIISGDKDGYSMVSFHKNGNRIYHITGPSGTIEYYKKE